MNLISARLQTCRICKKGNWEDRSPMVRVGTRHSVHLKCKMDKLPDKEARQKWLQSLPQFKIERLLVDLEMYAITGEGDPSMVLFILASVP